MENAEMLISDGNKTKMLRPIDQDQDQNYKIKTKTKTKSIRPRPKL